jgi:hypothetical protein
VDWALELFTTAGPLVLCGWPFGVVLKLSDLLQEHGYRWFRGAAMVTGVASAALAVAMLLFGNVAWNALWLAVVGHWILRGRIDGENHGVMAVAVLIVSLHSGVSITAHAWELAYFFGALSALGLTHDALQYGRARAPKPIEWFFENQHLYWYLLAIGYLALFEPDWALAIGLVAFVKGYGFLYSPANRARLGRIGVKPPPATKPDDVE